MYPETATERTSRRRLRLFRWRSVPAPTGAGCLVLLLGAVAAVALLLRPTYAFLAPDEPVGGGLLIVEGWLPDNAMPAVVDAARSGRYTRVVTTGGPIDAGEPLEAFGSLAAMTRARLLRAGLPEDTVTAVPAPPARRDRTWNAALALRRALDRQNAPASRGDLYSLGPHARRSRLLFRRALGPAFELGVRALPPPRFDARDWWRTSEGFKTVLTEWLSYAYARLGGDGDGAGEAGGGP